MKRSNLNELALFAGSGGGILGGLLHGWRTVAAVEIEDYPRRVLLQRQADGILPRFPIWDDVRTFKGEPWRGLVDVITGGFPCQDISAAGKGEGLTGSRSGLWFHMLRIVDEVRPRFVFAENSPNLRTRGLGTVIEGLNGLGYDVRWCVLGAGDVGAPHERKRMWILASKTGGWSTISNSDCELCNTRGKPAQREEKADSDSCRKGEALADTSGKRPSEALFQRVEAGERHAANGGWWATEPDVGRVANGVAHRVDRIKAIGNGQVPAVAALAFRILSQEIF